MSIYLPLSRVVADNVFREYEKKNSLFIAWQQGVNRKELSRDEII